MLSLAPYWQQEKMLAWVPTPPPPVSDAYSYLSCHYLVGLFSRRWMHLNAVINEDTTLKIWQEEGQLCA